MIRSNRRIGDIDQGPEKIVLKLCRLARQLSRTRCDAFYIPRIEISTNVDAFILPTDHVIIMRLRPEGPRIPVPNWLIEWSKSRDLFLSLAHDPWVFRPN